MSKLTVSRLYRYPVKSLKGHDLDSVVLTPRGFLHDRSWMLVDEHGKFITQRQHPSLAQILVDAKGDADCHSLTLRFPSGVEYSIESRHQQESQSVQIWSDSVKAFTQSHEVNTALSNYLGFTSRLVFMPGDVNRQIDPDFAQAGENVSFADGFPVLIATEASLEAVSELCGETMTMERFRPNLVIAGARAWQEETWSRLSVGGAEFALVKPCTRCVLTTVDPDTGQVHPRKLPLSALAQNKRGHSGVVFGMNAIIRGLGTLSVGDAVTLLPPR